MNVKSFRGLEITVNTRLSSVNLKVPGTISRHGLSHNKTMSCLDKKELIQNLNEVDHRNDMVDLSLMKTTLKFPFSDNGPSSSDFKFPPS